MWISEAAAAQEHLNWPEAFLTGFIVAAALAAICFMVTRR